MTSNKSKFRQFVAAIFAAFTISLVSTPAAAQPFDNIWHVDDDAAGGDGETWSTAFKYLQDALDEAEDSIGTDLIQVAQGQYIPSLEAIPGNPRSVTFSLNGSNFDNITIEGGYAGINEPDPDLRDVELYVTNLSGEIGGSRLDDNAYHVMTIEDVNISVRIDGLRLIDGYADGSPSENDDRGGGILILDADPLIVQCTIFNCTAIDGGGMAILVLQQFGSASPTVVNCRFVADAALTGDGGGIFNFESSVDLTNCIFDGCSALSGSGGAIFNGAIPLFSGSTATLVNCTIAQCDAAQIGGLFTVTLAGSTTVTNCILWSNTNGQINNAQLIDVTATFSCIEGGFPHGPFEGPGQGNISDDPEFLDPDGPNNIPGDEDDDLRLALGSPCNDAASNAALPPDVADLDADSDPNEPTPRDLGLLTRVTFDANENSPCGPIAVDMGAHENADCNDNGVRDELELEGNDVNGDGIPDDCQDCNNNGILDPDEIEGNDCNGNGIPDECDILMGCAQDCDGDGIPDECDPSLGTNLRQFSAPISGNGRGMAFDGTYLYYTRCVVGEAGCELDAAIYQIDTLGALQSTIIPACPGGPDLNRQIGALAFDDTVFPTLWAATYDDQAPIIVQIDIATGDVLQTIDALPVNVNDSFPTYIDGLAFDPRDGSLYYSSDLGFEVFNIAASGGSECTAAAAVQNPDKGYVLAEADLSGHAFDGMFLYSAQPADDQGDGNSGVPPQIFRTFIDAPTVLLNFRALHMGGSPFSVEDLAFDSVTFPQKCAVWANRSGSNNLIAAFEVPCPCAAACPWDLDGSGTVGAFDLLALLAAWGSCPAPCPPDFDGDGTVGASDLLALLSHWGPCGTAPKPPKSVQDCYDKFYPDDMAALIACIEVIE